MGFMSRADVVNGHVGGGCKWTETTKSRKYQDVLGAVFGSSDFQGNLAVGAACGVAADRVHQQLQLEYKFAYNPRDGQHAPHARRAAHATTCRATRRTSTSTPTASRSCSTSSRPTTTSSPRPTTRTTGSAYPGVEWKPVSNLTIRIGPGYEDNREDAQYVTTIADPTASATYGGRYDLRQPEPEDLFGESAAQRGIHAQHQPPAVRAAADLGRRLHRLPASWRGR